MANVIGGDACGAASVCDGRVVVQLVCVMAMLCVLCARV